MFRSWLNCKHYSLFLKVEMYSSVHWWILKSLPPLYNILCHALPQSPFFGDTCLGGSIHTQTLTLTTGPYNYAPKDPVKTCHVHGRHKAASIISPSCKLLDFLFLFMWLFPFIIIFFYYFASITSVILCTIFLIQQFSMVWLLDLLKQVFELKQNALTTLLGLVWFTVAQHSQKLTTNKGRPNCPKKIVTREILPDQDGQKKRKLACYTHLLIIM